MLAAAISHSSIANHFSKYLISKLTALSFFSLKLSSLMECAKFFINCTGLSSMSPQVSRVYHLEPVSHLRRVGQFVGILCVWQFVEWEVCFINPPKWYEGYLELPPTKTPIFFFYSSKGRVWLLSSEQLEQPVSADIRLGLSDLIYTKTRCSQRDPPF